jgi:hypothetical protein
MKTTALQIIFVENELGVKNIPQKKNFGVTDGI